MTRYTPLWQQAGTYPAATDRGLLSTLWPSSGSTMTAITTVSNTMNVSIPAGVAAVSLAGNAGTELCRWDTAEVVTLTAAPPAGQSRVDLIVLQVRDNALDAGGNNDFVFQAIAGTPTTGTPTVPATPTNAYPICRLTVTGGTANLNGVTVTDLRRPLPTAEARNARVYSSIAQTLPQGVTVVNFDKVEHDFYGLWSSGVNRFAIPFPGNWLLTARVEVDIPVAQSGRLFLEAILDPGTVNLRRGPDNTGGAQLNMGAVIATQIRVDPALGGTQIGVRVTQVLGQTVTVHPGLDMTYAELAYLGP